MDRARLRARGVRGLGLDGVAVARVPAVVRRARASAAGGGADGAAIWPLREQPLWLSVPVGAVVYIAALALLGAIDRERLAELR